MKEQELNRLFPVFLKLENMKLLIVGGGRIGLEKLQSVLSNAPATRIFLVGLVVCEEIKSLARIHSNLSWEERLFLPMDLDDVHVVIVAINDPEDARRISDLAKEKAKLVNVADKPEQCDFYMGSIVQKKNLKIAISTNGKSPTMAKRLKELFAEILPDELEDILDNMQLIREKLKGDFADKVNKLNHITRALAIKENSTSRNL